LKKRPKARCLLQHANAWRVRRTISALETTRRTEI